MLRSLIFVLLCLFGCQFGVCSSNTHDTGVPFVVVYQFINVLIVIFVLAFFLRKNIREFFLKRQQSFQEAMVSAVTVKKEAELKHARIKESITAIESSVAENLQKAKSEAAELRAKIVKEAQELSARLEQDAKRIAEAEIQRAKEELRQALLEEAAGKVRDDMKQKLTLTDHQRFQQEFVTRIATAPEVKG